MFEAGQIAHDDFTGSCQTGKPLAHRREGDTHFLGNLQIEPLTIFL
jgi:hypothetical protein